MRLDGHTAGTPVGFPIPTNAEMVSSEESNGVPGSCKFAGSRVSLRGVGRMFQKLFWNVNGA